jgi:uncharacterized phiE125 gp8 family phage protein
MLVSAPYRISTPTGEVLDAQAVRAYVKPDEGEDEESLMRMIRGARDWCQRATGLQLGVADFAVTLSGWPSGCLTLDKAPFVELVGVEYIADGASTYTALPADQVLSGRLGEYFGWVSLTGALPALASRPDAVKVTFKAGYALDTVPEDLRDAMLSRIRERYDSPGDAPDEKRRLSESLAAAHRLPVSA